MHIIKAKRKKRTTEQKEHKYLKNDNACNNCDYI